MAIYNIIHTCTYILCYKFYFCMIFMLLMPSHRDKLNINIFVSNFRFKCNKNMSDWFQTRMQILVPDPRANYKNVVHALYRIVRYEGLRSTLRGINVMAYGAGPAHAMYFACYEKLKHTL